MPSYPINNNVHFGIAPTDLEWFSFLKDNLISHNINFWTPTPWNIKGLSKGEKLYFMLKSPIRRIGGYGEFASYQNMSISDAWNKFGINNGVDSLERFYERLSSYVKKRSISKELHNIGCIALNQCVFLDQDDYFDPEKIGANFPNQVVKIKYFKNKKTNPEQDLYAEEFKLLKDVPTKKKLTQTTQRSGQQKFRLQILQAYNYKCCISNEGCEDVLEAAHIQNYISKESNSIQNGLCLRSDIHKLFDRGLISISTDFKILISSRLKSVTYQKFHNKKISLPVHQKSYPSIEAIKFHNKQIFRE